MFCDLPFVPVEMCRLRSTRIMEHDQPGSWSMAKIGIFTSEESSGQPRQRQQQEEVEAAAAAAAGKAAELYLAICSCSVWHSALTLVI